MGRVFEVGHLLEEGRDVQCDVLRSRLREPTPTAEEKDREDVVCSLRQADDVRPHGVGPKARAALSDRLEYLQRARGLRVRGSPPRWLLFSLECTAQPGETVSRSSGTPIGVAQQGREHGAMDMRVLSHVDRGEVKAERLDAAQQPLHTEQSRMLAAVRAQTRDDNAQITLELGRGGVAVRRRLIASRRIEARRDQTE